jgi:hypothetical protein
MAHCSGEILAGIDCSLAPIGLNETEQTLCDWIGIGLLFYRIGGLTRMIASQPSWLIILGALMAWIETT